MAKKNRKKQPNNQGAEFLPTIRPGMPIGEIMPPSSTDVLGSYTGVPEDGGVPVQDADDL